MSHGDLTRSLHSGTLGRLSLKNSEPRFEGIGDIDSITYKIDVTGSKIGYMKLSFLPTEENQDAINRLQYPGRKVRLVIEQDNS